MASSDATLTIAIVPGAWHRAVHVQPLIQALKRQGYQARCIELATVCAEKPRPTWHEEISNITEAVLSELEAGKDVCLTLHSYAGLPGSEALNQLVKANCTDKVDGKGRLRCVVFLAAHHFPVGIVVDTKQFVGSSNPSFFIDDLTGMSVHTAPYEEFFNDMSWDAAQPYVDAIKPMHYIPGGGALSSDDWMKVPRMLVGTKKDAAISPDLQKMMWNEQEHEIRWIDTDHSPFLSNPELVADLLIEAANKG